MFNTKLEVDRHVENCLKKINSESERNLKCYSFATLYFKVGDYEQARRYITIYLNIKPRSPEAQQLLGRILEKLGKIDAALEAYRTSLNLDPKQNKLVLKVCELLASDNVNFDQPGARYFCEKAQSIDPNNPSIFALKEKLILSEGKDPDDVSKLLLKELVTRPNDVNIQLRLLRHFLQNNKIKEAYDHVRDIEQKNLLVFLKNLSWYETIAEILLKYRYDTLKKNLNWEFWILLISVLDKLVELSLDERSVNVKTTTDYINTVFNFDQSLKVASENLQDCPDKNLTQEFLNHYRGQLCLHLITLVYKQSKKELIKYKEASQVTLPLLFAAYHLQPVDLQSLWVVHSSESSRKLVQRWNREASYRCSQTGHMLLSIAKDRKSTVIEKANQCSSGLWRENLLKRIFVTRDYQSKIKNSYFATCNQLVELVVRLPDTNEIIKYDETAQLVHPDSLHHYIWVGLNRTLSNFKCSIFEGLPYSVKNLNNCSAESLNVLDIHAFLYCAVLCAQQQLEEQKHSICYPNDKPNVLPAAVTNQLGTLYQSKWLISAYKMFTNDYDCDFSEVRLTLIKGIETIRCIGNHGLDVKILVTLAKIFSDRSKHLKTQSEIEQNDARAELYWKTALPLLERLKNNQTISYSLNRLFEYKIKEMPLSEIQTYIDDGKLFNAIQLMKKKEYEKALQLFESLKDPYASFYQAQIYKIKAEEQTSRNKESVTSEMRSQNIILLSRARDCLYLTFDRLRDPSVDRRHPLNSQLGTEIDKIERMLSRIDPDTCLNRNECDGMSDENMSSLGSTGDHFNYIYGNSSFINGNMTPKNDNLNLNSTPLRTDIFRREARPSPERLDAQLRQLLASKDTAVSHILEQNKYMIESHRALLDEIRGFKDIINNAAFTADEMKSFKSTLDEIKDLQKSVDELKNSVDDLKNVTDDVLKMKKEIAELKKDTLKIKSNQISDEDLYGLDEDYNNDYSAAINSNVAGLPTNLYPTLGRLPPTNSLQYGPTLYPNVYPMLHYPGIGLPQTVTGALPYGPENQIDFRTISSLSQGLGQSATYLQPVFSQAGLPQGLAPGSLSQGLTHGGLSQTVLPPTGFPQNTLTHTSLAQLSHSNLVTGQPIIPSSSVFSTISSTTIPTQSIFSAVSTHMLSTSIASTTTSSFISNNLPSRKAPPVNVVITSSDPLPSIKSTPQPVLSVTIPPQHLKGNQQKSQPHNYQIQLPVSTAIITPSIVNQPPAPISTQNLLANIAPPIYSAIDKSPSKGVILGLAIEKSLSQSFGSPNSKMDLNKSSIFSTSTEDHDPCPDFKPIIPLPDEVPVNTGEENETVLFEERAKLFRYSNKEWRERGTGILKLLKNVTTEKVRLLMRRDQVHKICANHFLTKEMTLTPMINNDRAYIWAANDFADQEIVLEKLCVKFKTPDIAQRFFKAFEDAKNDLPDTNVENVEKSKGVIKELTTKKDDLIQAKIDSVSVTSLGGFVFTSTPTFKPKTTSPTSNDSPPIELSKPSPFASFTFSKPATTIPSTIAFTPVITNFKPVQNNNEHVLDFTSQIKESLDSTDIKLSENDDSHVEEYEPPVDFKPVIPLPELVEIKTGEENAEVLFEQKAKLLRFDAETKEWKERGIGQMKILKYDNMIRLIMRREQVHKVCCNHQLLKSTSFSYMPKNTKALCWYAQDFSEGTLVLEMFAIKFKNEEQTKLFHNAVLSAQKSLNDNNFISESEKIEKITGSVQKKSDKKVKGDTEPKKIDTSPTIKQSGLDKYKPKAGCWECKNCYVINEGKNSLCMACETPRNENSAKKEYGSSPQFSFNIKNQSTRNTSFNFNPKVEVKDSEKSETENKSGWGNAFKPPADSWECKTCFVRNTKEKLYCISCESPKDETVPKREISKGMNLDTPGFSFNFGIPSTSVPTVANPSNTNVSFTFGTPITKSSITTFSFGNTLPENKHFTFTVKSDQEDDVNENKAKFIFGSPQKHTFDFVPRSPRRQSGGHGEEESEGSYIEEEEDNIYFKPVIPLPEKVEVKTGEELEDVIYCHRAKLFRFTDGEWKERGLGDIKILKQRDTGKLRVVMRREQVLKICLNHMLTEEINYIPKDDKTWLFSAPDYSEAEIQHRQFCLRFKNGEIAQDFKKAIDSALNVQIDAENKLEDSDIEIIFETKVTFEEEEEARKLGLPPKFMSYRQLSDCTCAECKKDDILLKDILSPNTNAKESSALSSSIAQSSTITSFGIPLHCSVFGSPHSETVFEKGANSVGGTSTPTNNSDKTETLKDLLIKPSLFSATQLSTSNKSTFSSPTLVNAAINKSVNSTTADEKFTYKAGDISSFSFTLKPENQPTTSTSKSIFNISTPTIFGSPNKSGSILNTPSATGVFGNTTISGNIFGGNSQSFSSGNIFGGNTQSFSSGNIFEDNKVNTLSKNTITEKGNIIEKAASAVNLNTSIFSPKLDGNSLASGDTGKAVPEKSCSSSLNTIPTTTSNSEATSSKSVNFTSPVFGSNITQLNQENKVFGATPIFGNSQKKTVFGNALATLTFGSSTSQAPLDCTINNAKLEEKKFEDFLKSDPDLTFASLAKVSDSTAAFTKSEGDGDKVPFAFLGAGAPVFSAKKAETAKDKDKKEIVEEKGGEAVEEEYDPHYEPIIPLPDTVVVSTGEEDEAILFNERAKLFRYDVTLKEWKERGVGQLKILHHPINHTYRMLLRREQIHKVVLNQLITTDLDLQPMSSTDKAWCWGGYNYSEDDHSLEKLAAKFKNVEISKQFYDAVQNSIKANREYHSTQKLIPSTLEEYVGEDVSGDDERDTGEEVEGEEEEDLDYYEDDDEDERAVMFKERCTLREQISGEWKTIVSGVIIIFYDSEIYGTRISFYDDYNVLLSNTLIGVNTVMKIENNVCTWRAVEWANNIFQWKTLQAIFETEEIAERFHIIYQEGVSYAEQSGIIDNIPTFIDPE